ncbi:MAG: HK97 family phage prohead protease [Pirellulaceae bacterium]
MTMEIRTNERAKPKATTGRIQGIAAVFYRAGDPSTEYELWKGAVERIMPGAFDKTLPERDVVALWQHDHTRPLGRLSAGTLTINVDAVGLHYAIARANRPYTATQSRRYEEAT